MDGREDVMSTVIRSKKIYCDEDCRQEGCPSHVMELHFQTTANVYSFRQDDKTILCIDRAKMRALLEMLKMMNHRVEVENDLKCLNP
jgi:hypothetical protein